MGVARTLLEVWHGKQPRHTIIFLRFEKFQILKHMVSVVSDKECGPVPASQGGEH